MFLAAKVAVCTGSFVLRICFSFSGESTIRNSTPEKSKYQKYWFGDIQYQVYKVSIKMRIPMHFDIWVYLIKSCWSCRYVMPTALVHSKNSSFCWYSLTVVFADYSWGSIRPPSTHRYFDTLPTYYIILYTMLLYYIQCTCTANLQFMYIIYIISCTM